MEEVTFDTSIVPTKLSDSDKKFISARIAENIIPNINSNEQPIFILNYVPTTTVQPTVETHRALYSRALFSTEQTKQAIIKREWRGRGDNYAKEKERRKKRRTIQLASETAEEKELRLAKSREAVIRHRINKAKRREESLLNDRIVFAEKPSNASSTNPFYAVSQATGLYTIHHHIERLELHNFIHSFVPIGNRTVDVDAGEKNCLFTLEQQENIGRKVLPVTAVFSTTGTPYQTPLPKHSFQPTGVIEPPSVDLPPASPSTEPCSMPIPATVQVPSAHNIVSVPKRWTW